MMADGGRDYRITSHALSEIRRRGIDESIVEQVLAQPEQEIPIRPGRVVRQSRITMGETERRYLVRVIVDLDRDVPEVVTVYRTSKVDKYWRTVT
ncbi:MAG: DUF4258 domain-containing protein [Candidatus Rokubacteria bacterium]|nr:DUF4258 domain-containing protein [Candidatus Rokubacteria bacterium]